MSKKPAAAIDDFLKELRSQLDVAEKSVKEWDQKADAAEAKGNPLQAAVNALAALSERNYILSMCNIGLLALHVKAEFEAGDQEQQQALQRLAGEAAKSLIAFKARQAKTKRKVTDDESAPGYA